MYRIFEILKKNYNITIVILLMVILAGLGGSIHLTKEPLKRDPKVQNAKTKSNSIKAEQTIKNKKKNQNKVIEENSKTEDEKAGSKSTEVKQDTKQVAEIGTKKQASISDNTSANENSNLNEQPVQPGTPPTGLKNDDSSSGEPPKQESTNAGNLVEADSNISELPKEPIWHEPVYEQRWVVDQAAWDETISEPVYSTVERAICNECGVDITANVEGHMLEYMHGWHSEWQQIQSDTNTYTVHHQEVGHYEQILVKEGYWE